MNVLGDTVGRALQSRRLLCRALAASEQPLSCFIAFLIQLVSPLDNHFCILNPCERSSVRKDDLPVLLWASSYVLRTTTQSELETKERVT